MRAEIVEALVGPYHNREELGYAIRLLPENPNEATLLQLVIHDYIHCACDPLDSRYRSLGSSEPVRYTEVPDDQRSALMLHGEVHFSKHPVDRCSLASGLARAIERASRTESGHRAMSLEELEHVILDAIDHPLKMALRK